MRKLVLTSHCIMMEKKTFSISCSYCWVIGADHEHRSPPKISVLLLQSNSSFLLHGEGGGTLKVADPQSNDSRGQHDRQEFHPFPKTTITYIRKEIEALCTRFLDKEYPPLRLARACSMGSLTTPSYTVFRQLQAKDRNKLCLLYKQMDHQWPSAATPRILSSWKMRFPPDSI